MRLIFSEPVIIDRGPTYEEAGWGPYQFPHLYRLDDGRILYAFADSGDTIDAYSAWLKLDDHTAALAYSNFQIKDEQGIARKTMLYCTVTVEG